MAEAGEFKVGDRAVYPVQGVVEVIRIEEKDLGGSRQSFYVLAILGVDRRILVPVANASAVGLRPLVSPDEIVMVLAHLADRPSSFDGQTWNRRARAFAERGKTGNVMDVADIVRELGWLRIKKTLSFGERRVYDSAKALLVKEIALARGDDEDLVRTEIDAIFGVPEVPLV